MKRGWHVAAWTLLAMCLLFSYESFQLSLTDTLGPGPGFFPFWLGVLGALLAVALLVQLHLSKVDLGAAALEFDRAGVRSVIQVVVALAAASALLEILGFRVSMLLLLGYLLFILGVRSRLAIAVFAVVGSFGVFHVFFNLLRVPLPMGILSF
jgi:putative tricarboxylic transport membrane protein